jgi:hypothetical protein
MPEPDDAKVSRPVRWGGGWSNPCLLTRLEEEEDLRKFANKLIDKL